MLSTKQPAPPIDAVSIFGRHVDLSDFRGKKVLVKFHRFSGCPVARRQIHDLVEGQAALNAAGIETIVVLHSSEEKMRPNFDEVPGLHLIGDREKTLYQAYQAEFLWRRLLSAATWAETLTSFTRGYLPQFNRSREESSASRATSSSTKTARSSPPTTANISATPGRSPTSCKLPLPDESQP
jgi:peroxiredoxin